MGSGFSKMKKQARAMQEQYSKMRDDMKNKRVTGVSGNGLVTIVLDGEGKMVDIQIKPECVDPNDIEGLQDLIRAAFEHASSQLNDEKGGELGDLMGSLPFSL